MSSKVSATAVTAHSRRNQLHRKYQNGQKGKSLTGLECAAYTPNYWWLDYIPDDGVHRFLLLLLKHRWKHTGQTLIENPKITETGFPLSFREILKPRMDTGTVFTTKTKSPELGIDKYTKRPGW